MVKDNNALFERTEAMRGVGCTDSDQQGRLPALQL